MTALVHGGKAVYLPFGASGRCDLIYQDADGLHRMQVKNGILRGGIVRFATCSNTANVPIDYREDVDVFGVYCHELQSVFVVPVTSVPLRAGFLRVRPARNNQQRNIRWAEQFRLDWTPPVLSETEPGACSLDEPG